MKGHQSKAKPSNTKCDIQTRANTEVYQFVSGSAFEFVAPHPPPTPPGGWGRGGIIMIHHYNSIDHSIIDPLHHHPFPPQT